MPSWRWEQVAEMLDNPKMGAELGVKEGRFTSHMLRTFPQLRMIAVDLWEPRAPIDREGFETYDGWDFDDIIAKFGHAIAGYEQRCDIMRMSTLDAAANVAEASLDFVFIDAEHTYEAVRADILTWRWKLKPGGLLAGHDYNDKSFPGVCRAVDELCPKRILGSDTVWMIRV